MIRPQIESNLEVFDFISLQYKLKFLFFLKTSRCYVQVTSIQDLFRNQPIHIRGGRKTFRKEYLKNLVNKDPMVTSFWILKKLDKTDDVNFAAYVEKKVDSMFKEKINNDDE